jgi:hypothetical protein
MRAIRWLAVMMFAGGTMPVVGVAQSPGDSIRFRYEPGSDWHTGRLIQRDSGQILLRQVMRDTTYRFAGLDRVEVWRRQDMALNLGITVPASALLWAALPPNGQPLTGSRGTDALAGAGVGAVIALAMYAINPGSWHKIHLP